MLDFDIVIVGGGMVGLVAACNLASSGLNIAILEQCVMNETPLPTYPTVRASAINEASKQFLSKIAVWPLIESSGRLLRFNQITVWEQQGFAKLAAHAHDFQLSNLGFIIENQLIHNSLLACIHQSYKTFSLLFLCKNMG